MIGTLLVRYPGSGALHYVDVSDEGPLPPVNQLTLATQFDTMACGVAAAESLGRMRGRIIPSDATILWDEGNTGKGASIQGVVNGLAAMGLHAVVESVTPAGPLNVMNPWGGVDVPPSQSAIWLNAAAVGWPGGWFIRVTDPPAAPTPEDDDMGYVIINTGQGEYLVDLGTGVYAGTDGGYAGPHLVSMTPDQFNGFVKQLQAAHAK